MDVSRLVWARERGPSLHVQYARSVSDSSVLEMISAHYTNSLSISKWCRTF